MDNRVAAALQQVIADFGADVAQRPDQLRALLFDRLGDSASALRDDIDAAVVAAAADVRTVPDAGSDIGTLPMVEVPEDRSRRSLPLGRVAIAVAGVLVVIAGAVAAGTAGGGGDDEAESASASGRRIEQGGDGSAAGRRLPATTTTTTTAPSTTTSTAAPAPPPGSGGGDPGPATGPQPAGGGGGGGGAEYTPPTTAYRPPATTATTAAPPPPPPPPPPPAAPTVRFSGPSTVRACYQRETWTVTVTDATSGTWRDDSGWTEPARYQSLSLVPRDHHSTYTYWIEYTAHGPGGSATARHTITIEPDDRVSHVRSPSECDAAAGV